MNNKILTDKIKESRKYIKNRLKFCPKTALIVGSGLSNIKHTLKDQISIPYSQIPNFKTSTVEGHIGELVIGKMNNVDVFLLNGRIHYYEGYTMQEVSYPVRVMKSLGVENLVITCAVGAVNKRYKPGDVVVIKDHINFSGSNPLIGKHFKEFGARFPDMTEIYDKSFRSFVIKTAKNKKIKLYEGIYFAVSGPSYETPAEISAYSKLGADVVGMSLVGESIVAKQVGMKILALTYVSNKASGLSKNILSHKEVLEAGEKASVSIEKIVKDFVRIL